MDAPIAPLLPKGLGHLCLVSESNSDVLTFTDLCKSDKQTNCDATGVVTVKNSRYDFHVMNSQLYFTTGQKQTHQLVPLLY